MSGEWVVELGTVLRWVRRHSLFGLVIAVLAGATTAYILHSAPPVYRSTATLAVLPTKLDGNTASFTGLSVQTYESFLRSPSVVAEASAKLRASGTLAPDEDLQVGRELRTRIFVSRREETRSVAPLLEAEVRFRRAGDVAKIANTWAAVLVDRAREVFGKVADEQALAVEALHPSTREQLVAVEEERLQSLADFERRRTQRLAAWSREVLKQNDHTVQSISKFEAETLSLMESRLDGWFSELGDEGFDTGGPAAERALRTRALNMLTAMAKLTHARPVIVLRKSMSGDDLLWLSRLPEPAEGEEGQPDTDGALLTEEFNPGYSSLLEQAERATAELSRFAELHGLEASTLIASLRAVEASRSGQYAMLLSELRSAEAAVMRRRAEELLQLEREQELMVAQLDREIERFDQLDGTLSKAFTNAALKSAQSDVHPVRLAIPAVPTPNPMPRNTALSILGAVLAGWVVGAALSVLWSTRRKPAR